MNKSESITLIDGQFSSDDAFVLLTNLYSSKIKFHQLKNFSSMERFGKEDEMSLQRISKLEESLKTILTLMKDASVDKNRIEIKSVLQINFLK